MRYEECSADVYTMLGGIVGEHFDELNGVSFKLVFDSKKKMKSGDYVFATIKKVNELTEFLASDEFNYVILIDKNIWDAVDEGDKIKILRHELRHVFLDNNANNPYKLREHEISDFYAEIELNKDDPRWAERVAAVAESVYEEDEE